MSGAGRRSNDGPGGVVSLGVDARALHATGVGRYLREVLAGIFADPRFGRVTLLGDPSALAAFAAEHGASARVVVRALRPEWLTGHMQLGWLALRARGQTRADVWFFPFSEVPLLGRPRRSVVTIHDLIPLNVPGVAGPRWRANALVALHAGTRHARRIIAISESTRGDVLARVPSAAPKMDVVLHGVGPAFRPLGPGEESECAGLHLPRHFLLCVGNRFPHKNQVAAVDTVARLRAQAVDVSLVFAGRADDVTWRPVLRHAQAQGVGDAVVDAGEVSDTQLRCLYARCTALMFPSLYEGFGFPVLEAMACGAPVIASNRSSLPEVVGDAGFTVDPHDTVTMADLVSRLLTEPALRDDCIRRGLARAARFRWAETIRRTTDILYRAAVD